MQIHEEATDSLRSDFKGSTIPLVFVYPLTPAVLSWSLLSQHIALTLAEVFTSPPPRLNILIFIKALSLYQSARQGSNTVQ